MKDMRYTNSLLVGGVLINGFLIDMVDELMEFNGALSLGEPSEPESESNEPDDSGSSNFMLHVCPLNTSSFNACKFEGRPNSESSISVL
jgi:hypothetical protein